MEADYADTWSLRGLCEPVEILVDRWGIPHLSASSADDLFFAQGFNAARDRLWQIDLWRRRGLGLLSEVFGASYVEKDRAARLFLYRGDMRSEWLSYGSDTKRVAKAFVAGINEYVRLTEKAPEMLPEEFRIMGYQPAHWSPEDIARIRSHGLNRNIAEEVSRALVLRQFGTNVESLRRRLEPTHEVTVPDGLDFSLIPDDVLRVYDLATSPVDFAGSLPGAPNSAEGSNNWAISPSRTATGRPILANDPHRDLSIPSLRYAIHLSAPGLDVIGAGEPALPGVSIGHNGRIAFGLTIFSIDQEDLYVYETNPENPSEYRYEGRWEPIKTERQEIFVKDAQPVEVELKFTRHGPVIHEDPERGVAFAVRAAWLEPGMAPYLGSIDYMRAQNWDGFLASMNRWGAPGENQVYADTEGNIGWKPGGLVPRRPNWDGLLPVPGDGRYEWDGFLDADELPVEFNPLCGWVASANEMNLPEGYSREDKKIGFEWHAPYRYERIAEVLDTSSSTTLEDSVKLQADHISVPARRVTARLRGLRSVDPRVEEALSTLRNWDNVLAADSGAAVLFEVWYRLHLREAIVWLLVGRGLGAEAVEATKTENEVGDSRVILDIIEAPEEWLGRGSEKVLAETILISLGDAMRSLERLLGPDPSTWKWGDLHHAHLAHPLSPVVDEEARGRLGVGPAPRGGSGDTVGNTAYSPEDFRQTGGSSWRLVVDVGGWDNSLAMNSPGQSGDPGSPHYDDLFSEWATDGAFPLLYSREKVEEATERRIVLEPKDRRSAP